MLLALALLLGVAVAVLAFGVFHAVRRQSSIDRQARDPAPQDGTGGRVFLGAIWIGLGLAVCGAVGYVLAAGWSGPYQGPMTGLPAALAMMASLGAIVLGLLTALLAFVLKLVSGSGQAARQDDTTPE